MMWLKYLLLCFNLLFISAVTLAEECNEDNKQCLIKYFEETLPHFSAGVPSLGLEPLDPCSIDTAIYEVAGYSVVFENTHVIGFSRCKVIDVERRRPNVLQLVLECPLEAKGTYTASGKLINIPVEGHGGYFIKTDQMRISIEFDRKIIERKDGEKYWKVSKADYSFEILAKPTWKFENLFNGDQSKARAINELIDQNWKTLVESLGKPVIVKTIEEFVKRVQKLFKQVPIDKIKDYKFV